MVMDDKFALPFLGHKPRPQINRSMLRYLHNSKGFCRCRRCGGCKQLRATGNITDCDPMVIKTLQLHLSIGNVGNTKCFPSRSSGSISNTFLSSSIFSWEKIVVFHCSKLPFICCDFVNFKSGGVGIGDRVHANSAIRPIRSNIIPRRGRWKIIMRWHNIKCIVMFMQ